MKTSQLKSNPFSVRNLSDSVCFKPRPDDLTEVDIIQTFPIQIKSSAESKMSEQIRFSKESHNSRNSVVRYMLAGSMNYEKDNLKFMSIISSDNSQKLFRHKCKQIEDEYLTCQCPKFTKQKCTQLQCAKNCVSFKLQNHPSLYETIRDSSNSAITTSGISQSMRAQDLYCQIPNVKPQVKMSKVQICRCEAGGCKNHKCPCKKIGQFCDLEVCDCRECRNLMLFSNLGNSMVGLKEQTQNESQSFFSQKSPNPFKMEEQNDPEFEQINFFIHIKQPPMDEER